MGGWTQLALPLSATSGRSTIHPERTPHKTLSLPEVGLARAAIFPTATRGQHPATSIVEKTFKGGLLTRKLLLAISLRSSGAAVTMETSSALTLGER